MNKVMSGNISSKRKTAPTDPNYAALLSLCCTVALLTACSKAPPEEAPPTSTPPSYSGPAPTGLVKNPVSHDRVADVTKWMDKASSKTPAQIAQEEKLAKEAKEAKEKLALEAKKMPVKTAPAMKDTPVPTAVAAAPVSTPVATKAPEPAPVVAAAPTTPAPAPAKAAEPERVVLKLLSSVQPKFPGTALRSGVTEGVVSARLLIEPDGKVSKVEIVKARPTKYFDKEVIAAASQWRYAPIPRQSTAMLEFNFHMD